MRIDFNTLEIKNFMSFADEKFNIASCKGMNLVQGRNNDIPGSKNGAGKSNLWMAVLYVLFGQLQSKIKNENLANRYASSRDMEVAMSFSVDGESYVIRRGLAKGKSSYLELCKTDDGNESNITKSTIPETQDFIEKELLHCDIALFLRTILLTADQSYNFYMLKKADKKEFVEKLFDISLFEDMHKLMHKDILELDKASLATQSKVMVLNKNCDSYESKASQYESTREAHIKVLAESVSKCAEEYENAKHIEVKSNTDVIAKLENALSKLRDEQDLKSREVQDINAKISKIELNIHKANESISAREGIISKHKDILGKLCNDCKQVFMDHYNISKAIDQVKAINAELNELADSKKRLESQAAIAQDELSKSKSKVQRAQSKMRELAEESSKASRALAKAEAALNEAKRSLSREKESINPYTELLSKCKSDITEETSKLGKISEKSKYLKYAEGIVSHETIQKFIVRDLVVLLNNKIKTYLTKLGAKYYVEFDEDMDYEFITPSGSFEWSNFSAGERMRIMVATSFAFRDFMSIRNGLSSNLLVLDEYFDSAIDSLCVESIVNILREYSNNEQQNVFVISHRPEVSPEQFDRLVLVEKTDGIAHIKMK